ncbi:hypothetical protein [Oleisolibacter albus]|uniref:hypothetical protein n=1 Tax=Oleisolibacter albus TaxID=2171757 RepID=UPI0012D798F0|nr:hypothetical protein [Oleisolibacter albus]
MFASLSKKTLCFIFVSFSCCSSLIAKESESRIDLATKFDKKEISFNKVSENLCNKPKNAGDLNSKNQKSLHSILDNEYLYKKYINEYEDLDKGKNNLFNRISIITFSINRENYLLIFFTPQWRDGRGVLYNLTARNKLNVYYYDLLDVDYMCITYASREPEIKILYRIDQCEYVRTNEKDEEKQREEGNPFSNIFSKNIQNSTQKRREVCTKGIELSAQVNAGRWYNLEENVADESQYIYFGNGEN